MQHNSRCSNSERIHTWRYAQRLRKEVEDLQALCKHVCTIESDEMVCIQVPSLKIVFTIFKNGHRCSTYPFFAPEVSWHGRDYFHTLRQVFSHFDPHPRAASLVFATDSKCHFCDSTLQKWRSTSRLRNVIHDIRSVLSLQQKYYEIVWALKIVHYFNLQVSLVPFLLPRTEKTTGPDTACTNIV